MRIRLNVLCIGLIGCMLCINVDATEPPAIPIDNDHEVKPLFTHDFGLEYTAMLMPDGGNQYMSIEEGSFRRLEGIEDGERMVVEITALDEIRPIFFKVRQRSMVALTRVVEEREWVDGELIEVTRNFYARDPDTSNIYYFGEEVDEYEDGRIISHEGSWMAGVDGAQPGLIMPSFFLLGARYVQGHAPDVSMDRAEHLAMGKKVATPAGSFSNCIVVEETTPLEPDEEALKVYAPGVGLIVDEHLRLVEYRR